MILTTMTKKVYIAPTLEIIDFEVENMLALSSEDNKYDGPELSNKRQPSMGTWSSTNWKTEEAY